MAFSNWLTRILFSFKSNVATLSASYLANSLAEDNAMSTWEMDPSFPSLQRGIRLVVLMALFCDFILLTIIIPVTPVLLPDDKIAFYLVGILYASKPLLQVLSNPFMGKAVDKFGSRPMLFVGLVILTLSTAAFAASSQLANITLLYTFLLISRAIQGLASAACMTAGMSWIATIHSKAARGSAMGVATSGIAFGILAGPLLGGVLTTNIGAYAPFVVITGFLILTALAHLTVWRRYNAFMRKQAVAANLTIFRNLRAAEASPMNSPKESKLSVNSRPSEAEELAEKTPEKSFNVYTDPYVISVAALLFVGNAAVAMLEPAFPVFVEQQFGYDAQTQGLVFSATTVGYMIAAPVSGRLADKYKQRKWIICLSGGLLLAFGLVLLKVLPDVVSIHDGSTGLLIFNIVGLIFVGAGMASTSTPSMSLLADIANMRGSEQYGEVFAVQDMSTSAGFVFGPIYSGITASVDVSFDIITLSLAIASVVLILPSFAVLRRISATKKPSLEDTLGIEIDVLSKPLIDQ